MSTVEAIDVLRNTLKLNVAHAKAVIDAAVFDGQVARALAETEEQARSVARQVADSAPDIFVTWTQPQHRVDGLILVIPSKVDAERDAVADAWQLAGGAVERLDRFWDPPPLPRERVRLYGPDTSTPAPE